MQSLDDVQILGWDDIVLNFKVLGSNDNTFYRNLLVLCGNKRQTGEMDKQIEKSKLRTCFFTPNDPQFGDNIRLKC